MLLDNISQTFLQFDGMLVMREFEPNSTSIPNVP
jgi:hypothetical protein